MRRAIHFACHTYFPIAISSLSSLTVVCLPRSVCLVAFAACQSTSISPITQQQDGTFRQKTTGGCKKRLELMCGSHIEALKHSAFEAHTNTHFFAWAVLASEQPNSVTIFGSVLCRFDP